jgi:hypothetical protein
MIGSGQYHGPASIAALGVAKYNSHHFLFLGILLFCPSHRTRCRSRSRPLSVFQYSVVLSHRTHNTGEKESGLSSSCTTGLSCVVLCPCRCFISPGRGQSFSTISTKKFERLQNSPFTYFSLYHFPLCLLFLYSDMSQGQG